MIARRVIVAGRVQGVGFRFFAERTARELGVTGWVRNLPDGKVEALAQGEQHAVVRFLERLHEGPRLGRVTQVEVEEAAVGSFDSFEITA